jgi:hypothetical protein
MKQNLFSGPKSEPKPDLSREEFVAELASIGRPLTQRFFVGTIIYQIREMMALNIQLATGETRTYSTCYPSLGENPSYHTKCALAWPNCPAQEEECNHLDCAIVAAKREIRDCILFLAFCFFFIALGITTRGKAIPDGFLGVIMVAFGVLIIAFAVFMLYRSYHSKNELTEFRDRCTINGTRAWKT